MDPATIHLFLVYALVVGVFLTFAFEWMPPDVIAMCALCVVFVTGILTLDDVLGVFSNHAPITIGCMFILSAALERTGAIDALARVFIKVAGRGELRALLSLMFVAAGLSAFMNNTPIVVVFMPIVLALARSTQLKASRLLIPLSFASIVGGTCTMIGTSTNLLVDGVARDAGLAPFTMFEPAKLGLIYVAIVILYLGTVGRFLLPRRETLSTLLQPTEKKEYLTQAIIGQDSPLLGENFTDTPLAKMKEVRIIEVSRKGRRLQRPLNKIEFQAGDRLLMKTVVAGVKGLRETEGLEFLQGKKLGLEALQAQGAKIMEGIIGPHSRLVGKTIRAFNFRQRYGVIVLAVHRQGTNLREQFEDVRLQFGDTLLIEGPMDGVARLLEDRDFIDLTEPHSVPFRRSKAPLVIGVLGAVMLLAGFGVMPIVSLALVGAVLVVATRCIEPAEAYRSVEWRLLFIIFGMLGLGKAMEVSGAAEQLAMTIIHVFGPFGPLVVLSALYLLTALLTEGVSNNAVAVLLTPIAIGIADQMGVDARPFVVAVMFGASASFMSPMGYQTNTYVYGAGGYRFMDFPKVGVPLALILWMTATFLIPILWPFENA